MPQHLVGYFLVVFDLGRTSGELGVGEVDPVAGDGPPVDSSGVLLESIALYHLLNDLVAEHVVALFLQLLEEARGVVLSRRLLTLLALVDLHVALVLTHQVRHLVPAVLPLPQQLFALQLLLGEVQAVLLGYLFSTWTRLAHLNSQLL